MAQLTLVPDPKPLDVRLGKEFFLNAPRKPGVYLMRDSSDVVVYVGKAKNLRQRLGSYRLANPDRMLRRHLRMVREVSRIEFQICVDETEAIQREAKLLLELKPKFNRAGVWPVKTKFIAWQVSGPVLQIAVWEVPEIGWLRFGPMKSSAIYVQQSLVRLLWLAVNPERGIFEMPVGWMKGKSMQRVAVHFGEPHLAATSLIESFFLGDSAQFHSWLDQKLSVRSNVFERSVIAADLEVLSGFVEKRQGSSGDTGQMSML